MFLREVEEAEEVLLPEVEGQLLQVTKQFLQFHHAVLAQMQTAAVAQHAILLHDLALPRPQLVLKLTLPYAQAQDVGICVGRHAPANVCFHKTCAKSSKMLFG